MATVTARVAPHASWQQRALPDGRQDRHRAGGQPQGHRRVDPKSLPYHRRHRALFVGYAPAENPTIAVAVTVEGGGFGGSTAAPIARKVFDAYLLGKMPEGVPPDADDAAIEHPQAGRSWPRSLRPQSLPLPPLAPHSPLAPLPLAGEGLG